MITINTKARKEICDHITSRYNKIEVKAGKCRFNYRCSANAVHDAVKNKDKKIAMCVYIDEGYPVIHFINYKKGVFTDNTLGVWSSQYDYYFIRWIKEDEFFQVDYIFESFRRELRNVLSWWTKLWSNYEC